MISYTLPVLPVYWEAPSEYVNLVVQVVLTLQKLELFLAIIVMMASGFVFPFVCLLLFVHTYLVSRNIATKEFFAVKMVNPLGEVQDYFIEIA